MIVLSLVLVIVAAVALIAGLFQPDDLTLIWVSIGACVTAMLFLGIGVLQRKRSTPATSGGYGPGRPDAPVRPGGSAAPSRPAARDEGAAEQPATASTTPAPAPTTPAPSATPAAPTATADAHDEDEETVIVRKASARRGAVKKKVVAKKAVAPAEAPDASPAAEEAPAAEAPDASPAAEEAPVAEAPSGPRKATRKKAGTKKATKKTGKKAARKKTAKKAARKKAAKKTAGKRATKRTTGAAARAVLSEVRGVGPAKQDALLKQFGSIEEIRATSVDELATVKGIGPALAAAIKDQVS